MAQINNINGVILLPDDWDEAIYHFKSTNTPDKYDKNRISLMVWETIESAGAVFLPAAGNRDNNIVYSGYFGEYWSSTYNNNDIFNAEYLSFKYDYLNAKKNYYRKFGRSVRLVQDY